jgi:hypothetical protein
MAKLEVAQQMAAHKSAGTTGLYDRRGDEISLDEVERIVTKTPRSVKREEGMGAGD